MNSSPLSQARRLLQALLLATLLPLPATAQPVGPVPSRNFRPVQPAPPGVRYIQPPSVAGPVRVGVVLPRPIARPPERPSPPPFPAVPVPLPEPALMPAGTPVRSATPELPIARTFPIEPTPAPIPMPTRPSALPGEAAESANRWQPPSADLPPVGNSAEPLQPLAKPPPVSPRKGIFIEGTGWLEQTFDPEESPFGFGGGDMNAPVTPPVPPIPYTLAKCQDLARRQNRARRQAQNNLLAAIQGQAIAESQVYAPRLSFTQDLSDQNDDGRLRAELTYLSPLGIEVAPFFSERSAGERDERWNSDMGITLRRQLFAAHERWRLREPLTTAERRLLQAQNTLQLQDRQLDFSVLRSFLSAQRVHNRLRVRRNRVKDAREFLKVTEERVEAGLAPRVDIDNARISLNQAEADVLNEEESLKGAAESLLNLLGAPVDYNLALLPYDLTDESTSFNLGADIASVRDRHETLVNLLLDLDFGRIGINLAEDLLRPNLGLALSAGRRAEGPVLNRRIEDSDSLALQLTYELPLDGKKREKARLRQLELAQENLQLDLVNAERRLQIELRAAHRAIARLETQVTLTRQRLEALERRLKATLVRYEDGNVDNLEVTRAKQAVDDAEISLINTQLDLVLAREEYRSILPPAGVPQIKLSAP